MEGAFGSRSQTLNALMNGEMVEAKTKCVDWSEVDEDTFARLCDFAYLRDYTPPPPFCLIDGYSRATGDLRAIHFPILEEPPPEPVPEDMPAEDPPEVEARSLCAVGSDTELSHKERSIWTGHLCHAFAEKLVVPGPQSQDSEHAFTPPRNTRSFEDFTPIFVGQARLYVLADKYRVESLSQLVLPKLHQSLNSFKLYETGVAGVVIEFFRLVYFDTPPNYADKVDAMGNLATRYVISILGQIGENEAFRELLEEGGDYVLGFWRIIWNSDPPSSDDSIRKRKNR